MLLPFDLVSLSLAWYLTINIRLLLNPFFSRHLTYEQLIHVAPPLLGVLFLWTITVLMLNMVRSPDASAGTSLWRVGEATLMAGLLAIVVTFFSRNFGTDLSRSHVILFLPISFATLIVGRYGCLLTMNWIDPSWFGGERIAFVGDTLAVRAAAVLGKNVGHLPIRVAGVILPEDTSSASTKTDEVVPILGTTSRLAEIINQARLTRLVFAGDNLKPGELDHCMEVSARM